MVTVESLQRALADIDRDMDDNGCNGQGKNAQQHHMQLRARAQVCRNLDAIRTAEHRLAQRMGRTVRVAFDWRNGEPVAIVQVVGQGTWTVYGQGTIDTLTEIHS